MEDQVEAVQTDEQMAQAERDFAQYELWSQMFTKRELQEIEFCNMYYLGFNHGTSDHNLRVIVAKLVDLLGQSYPAREYMLLEGYDNSK